MKKSTLILLTATLFGAVLPAAAGNNPVANIIQSAYHTMDANQDGEVSKSEFMAFHEEMGAKPSAAGIITGQFRKLDRDGDSMITMDEMMAHYEPMFSDAASSRISPR